MIESALLFDDSSIKSTQVEDIGVVADALSKECTTTQLVNDAAVETNCDQ